MTFVESSFLVSIFEQNIHCQILHGWQTVVTYLHGCYDGAQCRELMCEIDDHNRWEGAWQFDAIDDRCTFTSADNYLLIVRLPDDVDSMINQLVGIKIGAIHVKDCELCGRPKTTTDLLCSKCRVQIDNRQLPCGHSDKYQHDLALKKCVACEQGKARDDRQRLIDLLKREREKSAGFEKQLS